MAAAEAEAERGHAQRRLGRGLLLSVAAGAVLYVAIAAWSGFDKVGARLAEFSWAAAGAALGLAAANYGLRFLKWHYYLGRLGLAIPVGRSLAVFLSGFALTVTPGKVGEVLKAYLLRETDGVPMARTAPIVIAERVTDLIACLLLTLLGLGAFEVGDPDTSRKLTWVWVAGGGSIAALLGVVALRPLGEAAIDLAGRVPGIGKIAPKLREFYASTRTLLGPLPTLVATTLSVAAWACECGALWVVLRGFPSAVAAAVPLARATFIYAAMTIAGALSFLPGGLGVQEGGMVELLVKLSHGLDEPTAVAATFVTRLCTLWFAVLVGVLALLRMRRVVAIDLGRVAALKRS